MTYFSEKHKVVLICIPKTGSTTLTNRLELDGFKIDRKLYRMIKSRKNSLDRNYFHLTYEELIRINKSYQSYAVVCVTRNPYDRFYSAFLEFKKRYNRNMAFESYFEDIIFRKKYRSDARYIHGRPMVDFVFSDINRSTSSMTRPQSLFVLRQENFEEDFKATCTFFGLSCKDNTDSNISGDAIPETHKYAKLMTPEQLLAIETFYLLDFVSFNYKTFDQRRLRVGSLK